ncbi:MAG: four helix bundle protein [Candidatus Portnoybacteria bacterium]|nr:four helix bundle protein [Candidatus Portnoybacteria bacterium]
MHNFDLEERTLDFSKKMARACKILQKNIINIELIRQGFRAGTSIGANYIEANDALSKKDFVHRLRIARKEAKETIYWLILISETNEGLSKEIQPLIKEADELKRILLQ